MKRLLTTSLLLVSTATLGLASPVGHVTPSQLSAQQRCALVANSDDSLASMRAGAMQDATCLGAGERELLAQAQDNAPDLAAMRGGEVTITDHDLIIIGVVLLVVILIIAL